MSEKGEDEWVHIHDRFATAWAGPVLCVLRRTICKLQNSNQTQRYGLTRGLKIYSPDHQEVYVHTMVYGDASNCVRPHESSCSLMDAPQFLLLSPSGTV